MSTKPTYTIAVTGLNAIDSPGSGLAVIKGLREAEGFDVRIIGFAYESMEPGVYMHHLVDKSYQVPYPNAGQDVLYERISYINSVESLDIIIPNYDAELFNYIRIQQKLKTELDISMVLPTEDQFEERQKSNLSDFGEKHGIQVPSAEMAFSMEEAKEIASDLGFPVVVKGKFYDAKIAYTPTQVSQYFSQIAAEWGMPIIIQEFINGHEVNVCGIGNGKGDTLGAVPMKKIYVTDKGKAWSGVTLEDNELLEICEDAVASTKWNGPFEFEFMKTSEDKYYLLEINPRFPAWCYLAVGAGQNQTATLIELATGIKAEKLPAYVVGKMFIRHSDDMVIDMKEFETISTTGEL
ncbi:MAG TPA: ATP-grasp domain-containing protein [Flavobacteriales bacterium]|jgi:carbamoyl-phosphate synthase large subunit|nr:ATP-grasp domain-containing protein [Flavobacteriales bacterium]HHZ97716.1 ATP-grasp domain-containing protein [Flavobacteriales bacterium]HIB77948.1 ATP-grasp domain-containing protein [Flavobacteriales bacterium]HIN41655.1 ATP-grasp domain-containing protein [Flavobacteriales bacterium]HIO15642.1 ATP-grasp domain-containing protein [Flavobacteriales bacterium]